jgi:hypothetical protein
MGSLRGHFFAGRETGVGSRYPVPGTQKTRKANFGFRFFWVLSTVYCVLAFPASTVFAAEKEILGGHEGWLDRMGAGVRELGRGNTGTALADASPAAFWNPALLPFYRKTELAAGADVRSLDRNGGFLSFQGPVANNLGLGAGLVNRGDYYIPAYDENEQPLGVARPQAWATYFGAGMRTSRRNAFGATLLLYASTLDVGNGIGDVDFVGGVNLGWYHRFDTLNLAALVPESWPRLRKTAAALSGSVSTGVVIRNLGLNGRLSSEFDQTVTANALESSSEFQASVGNDFFPKTLVLAAEWRNRLWHRNWTVAAEVMDYQLKNTLFTPNGAFHAQAMRLGVECEVAERTFFRAGMDRLNPTVGLGYAYRWSRARTITFDYALMFERGITTFNPYAAGIKTNF